MPEHGPGGGDVSEWVVCVAKSAGVEGGRVCRVEVSLGREVRTLDVKHRRTITRFEACLDAQIERDDE